MHPVRTYLAPWGKKVGTGSIKAITRPVHIESRSPATVSEEFRQFPPLLGMLVECLEQEQTDVLGRLYHRLEIHNEQTSQFFTPYPVCLAMAKMLVHDAKHLVEEKGFIRAQEPCVGSGAMVIALAQALREEDINYQQCLHVTAIDLDIVAVHMAYVQCTLLHIPAIILHGDTLRGEVYS